MSFLINPNKTIELYRQLQGFIENTYLDVAGELLTLPNFKFPEIQLTESDLSRVEVADNLRLGNRLERFFSFIIKETKQYEIVAENLQIFEDKRITIGEIDFILYDTIAKQYIHVELAGKIYLYDPNIEEELARWIGPNRRDSLLKKSTKLSQKQFPLLFNNATKRILEPLIQNVDNITQQICLKARLFVPYYLINRKLRHVSESNIKGYYINLSHFNTWQYKAYQYHLPNKQNWIVDPKYGEVWKTNKEVLPSIEKALENKMSPLVWVRKSETEFECVFVVWWS